MSPLETQDHHEACNWPRAQNGSKQTRAWAGGTCAQNRDWHSTGNGAEPASGTQREGSRGLGRRRLCSLLELASEFHSQTHASYEQWFSVWFSNKTLLKRAQRRKPSPPGDGPPHPPERCPGDRPGTQGRREHPEGTQPSQKVKRSAGDPGTILNRLPRYSSQRNRQERAPEKGGHAPLGAPGEQSARAHRGRPTCR